LKKKLARKITEQEPKHKHQHQHKHKHNTQTPTQTQTQTQAQAQGQSQAQLMKYLGQCLFDNIKGRDFLEWASECVCCGCSVVLLVVMQLDAA
jgi:hypothetical protein